MSSMGITQIAAVMGSCVAGGAYLPIMSDEAIIVEKTGSIFLAGSYLVKAAIGESIDNETLGGATTHSEISGVTDYKAKDDKDALTKIQNIMDKIGDFDRAGFSHKKSVKPKEDPDEIYGILPKKRSDQYDMRKIIERLVDNSEFEEYKEGYGQTIISLREHWHLDAASSEKYIYPHTHTFLRLNPGAGTVLSHIGENPDLIVTDKAAVFAGDPIAAAGEYQFMPGRLSGLMSDLGILLVHTIAAFTGCDHQAVPALDL